MKGILKFVRPVTLVAVLVVILLAVFGNDLINDEPQKIYFDNIPETKLPVIANSSLLPGIKREFTVPYSQQFAFGIKLKSNTVPASLSAVNESAVHLEITYFIVPAEDFDKLISAFESDGYVFELYTEESDPDMPQFSKTADTGIVALYPIRE